MPTHDLHLERWTPELRRAVVRVCPDFFGWPTDRQARYRVALPEEVRGAIHAQLIPHIVGADRRGVAVQEDDLSPTLQNQLNQLLLPLVGIGEDAFFLNEHFDEGLSILDFKTLRAYDEHDHATQEHARTEEDSDYVPQPYQGSLLGCWARVLIDGQLTYLTLSMAAETLHDRMEEAAAEELQRRIPHQYVPGRHDGEVEGDMVRWDTRIEAGGQEALLEELQHRVTTYAIARWAELRAERAQRDLCATYMVQDPFPYELPDERHLAIIFSGTRALESVRFETFLADCKRIERGPAELDDAANAEIALVHQFIAEQHEELLRTFDPKVTKLRRRKRIMVHQQAFDALRDDDNDVD